MQTGNFFIESIWTPSKPVGIDKIKTYPTPLHLYSMSKLRIAILFGGSSREREVSFAGGRTVYDNLDKGLFEAIPVFVDSFGNLVLLDWPLVYKGSIRDFYPPVSHLPDLPNGFQVYAESLQPTSRAQELEWLKPLGQPIEPAELRERVDFAFLALHGTGGEDGSIQGMLEWLGIPYSGSGIFPSAMGINKQRQKAWQTELGLYVNQYQTLQRSDWMQWNLAERQAYFHSVVNHLGSNCVVKPAHQGSSLGVSILKNATYETFSSAVDAGFFRLKVSANDWNALSDLQKIERVKDLTDLRSSLGLPLELNGEKIYRPDVLMDSLNTSLESAETVWLESPDSESVVLVESLIEGKEFSCIVVADQDGKPFALPPTEIRKNSELFDYRSKYLPGLSRKVTPIEVEEKHLEAIRTACCELYKALGFEVYARIDGFVQEDGRIFLNDPNTTSGMMPSSFFFHQAAEVGLNPSQFLTFIIHQSLKARIAAHPTGMKFQGGLEHLKSAIRDNKQSGGQKRKIAVIMGGYSFERHISMESGRNIFEKLASSAEFEPIPLFLAGDSSAYQLIEMPLSLMLKDNADDIRNQLLNFQENPVLTRIQKNSQAWASAFASEHVLHQPKTITLEELPQLVDGVFIALHGRPGEDGTLQQDLAKVGLYHNGSLAHSAALTINKYETNRRLRELGFLVADHRLVSQTEWESDPQLAQSLCFEFGLPLIAKPADDGCSAAVRKIKSVAELHDFMAAIFRKQESVPEELMRSLNIQINDEFPSKRELLIERFIDKEDADHFLEITGGMLTHISPNGELSYEVFEPSESLAESEILSLEEKFLAGEGQNLTPPRFSKNAEQQSKISAEVRKTLESVARSLDVTGYCRIDAFVKIWNSGKVETVIIEVNSLPGMTPATCIYHQASINGYKPFEFIREILNFGQARLALKG
ncbi:MAG: hypothetical protein RL577_501 [Bacteroidota bacterium]